MFQDEVFIKYSSGYRKLSFHLRSMLLIGVCVQLCLVFRLHRCVTVPFAFNAVNWCLCSVTFALNKSLLLHRCLPVPYISCGFQKSIPGREEKQEIHWYGLNIKNVYFGYL